MECVVCGKKSIGTNHKCEPKKVNQIEAAMKRSPHINPAKPFGQRLAIGFSVMNMAYQEQ